MTDVVFQQAGDAIDYTPDADVAAGDLIRLGSFTGVALRNIPANTLGSLRIEGVFPLPKAVGGGVTFATGDAVGWDATNKTAVAGGTGTYDAGVAILDAADGDDAVQVKLNW
jgi:predicted RecA/RadA family phage recombinase